MFLCIVYLRNKIFPLHFISVGCQTAARFRSTQQNYRACRLALTESTNCFRAVFYRVCRNEWVHLKKRKVSISRTRHLPTCRNVLPILVTYMLTSSGIVLVVGTFTESPIAWMFVCKQRLLSGDVYNCKKLLENYRPFGERRIFHLLILTWVLTLPLLNSMDLYRNTEGE